MAAGKAVSFGLPPETARKIAGVLRAHPEIGRAAIFGSRAMGNWRENSDIDLCLWGKIDEKLLARIAAELENLPVPQSFDLVVYDSIQHAALRDHIDHCAVDFPE